MPRPYKPIPEHAYHNKTDAELRFIQKDAYEAAQAMRGHDDQAEAKYLDQLNDASTVLAYRLRHGAAAVLTSGQDIDDRTRKLFHEPGGGATP